MVCSIMNSMEQESLEIAWGLRHRDPDLLDRLIEQYQYRLQRYLIYLVGKRETAEDLFQETWIRVLERGRQYNGKVKFETWLFAVARHLVIDLTRRKKWISLENWIDSIGDTTPVELESSELSPFEVAVANEQAERLVRVLGRLDRLHREVLILRFQEEMTLEEISFVVSAPLSTVKSRLYRGLGTLRSWLEGKDDATKCS
jgi:RNA polymerase sigma-70 factor (ECF subfamily)